MPSTLLLIGAPEQTARAAEKLPLPRGWAVRRTTRLDARAGADIAAALFLRDVEAGERPYMAHAARTPMVLTQVPTATAPPPDGVIVAPLVLLQPAHRAWIRLSRDRLDEARSLRWRRRRGAADEIRGVDEWLLQELPLVDALLGDRVARVTVDHLDERRLLAHLVLRDHVSLRLDVDLGAPQEPCSELLGETPDEIWRALTGHGRCDVVFERAGRTRRATPPLREPWPLLLRLLLAALKGKTASVCDEAARARSLALAARIRRAAVPATGPEGAPLLLVKPPRHRGRDDTVTLAPLGLARLQAFARARGIPTRVVDLDAQDLFDEAARLAPISDDARVEAWLAGAPDATIEASVAHWVDAVEVPPGALLVGLSVGDVYRRLHTNLALVIARGLKARHGDALGVVVGGDLEAIRPEVLARFERAVDWVAFGDGEALLVELWRGLRDRDRPLDGIPGLWRVGGGGSATRARARVPFAERPTPDFDGVPMTAYRRGASAALRATLAEEDPGALERLGRDLLYLPYYAVSGCNASCVFCNWHRDLDVQDPRRAAAEMVALSERHETECFYLLDPTLNLSRRFLSGFVEALLKTGRRFSWTDSARAHRVDADLARGMREAGCVMLSFGVESGSDAVLARMQKGFTADEAAQSLEATHAAGILNRVNLIAGFFHERDEDVEATLGFLDRHHQAIDVIGCFQGFYLFPGMGIDAEAMGVRLRDEHDVLPLGQRTLTYDELGGPEWPEKRRRIEESHARVAARLDALGVFRRDTLDEHDLFFLARLFPDKARRKRYLIQSLRGLEGAR
jgi:hypothetical protein